MVSIRNPFPKSKKATTGSIDVSAPSGAVTATTKTALGGKFLHRPSNKIANSAVVSDTSISRTSGLASLTRFPSSSSNQAATTFYGNGTGVENYQRNLSQREKENDENNNSTSATASSTFKELPRLYHGNSTSSIVTSSNSGTGSYQQRLQVAGFPSTTTSPAGPTLPATDTPTRSHPRGLVGLQNLGNTCCLQCVSNIPAIVKYFQSGLYTRDMNEASPTKGALALAFGDLIKALWTGTEFTSTRPVELKRVIGKVASRFTGYDQQDAQEFLRFLLDGLHEDLNKIKKKPPYYEIKDRDNVKDREVSDEYWKFYLDRNVSALSEVFCGQLRSEMRCNTCNHRSLCFDVFWDLSVPVPKKPKSSHAMRIANVFSSKSSASHDEDGNGSGCSIQDCMKAYTEQEFMNESDAYYCAKCKTHRAASKKISLYRLPQLLVIHLKRFSYSTFSRDKVNTAIRFPAQSLDVAEYCASDAVLDGSTLYNLVGVVNHVGTLNGGHYTAECINSDTNEWYDFNDATVSTLKKPHLCSSSAYILFFSRQEEKSLTI
ncbi:TPA: hypothetical protein N0F65_010182 [Lagenidium giganteum]|uniref:ubiquitinyl hydrolase 1 n=1 Tax=Lagenidium giganteum TaxID=4803 RepID=A0AAV2Z816_9STRA|nr:TPA: hypothetical protein N0F65_010182 [Lagenidium giganteum]